MHLSSASKRSADAQRYHDENRRATEFPTQMLAEEDDVRCCRQGCQGAKDLETEKMVKGLLCRHNGERQRTQRKRWEEDSCECSVAESGRPIIEPRQLPRLRYRLPGLLGRPLRPRQPKVRMEHRISRKDRGTHTPGFLVVIV